MGSPEFERLSIQRICERWKKSLNYVLELATKGALDVWISVQDVTVEVEHDIMAQQYHKRYELQLLPEHIAELVWPDDAQIETATLNGKGNGEDSNSYVQVYRALREDGDFIIIRADLYARLEDVEALDKDHGIGQSAPAAIEHNDEEIDTARLQYFARKWVRFYPEVPIKRVSLYECSSKWEEACRAADSELNYPLYVVAFEIEGLEWSSPKASILEPSFPLIGVDTPEDLKKKQHWVDFLEKVDNVPGRRRHRESPFAKYKGFEKIYNLQPTGRDYCKDWMFIAVGVGDELPDYVDTKGPKQFLYGGQEFCDPESGGRVFESQELIPGESLNEMDILQKGILLPTKSWVDLRKTEPYSSRQIDGNALSQIVYMPAWGKPGRNIVKMSHFEVKYDGIWFPPHESSKLSDEGKTNILNLYPGCDLSNPILILPFPCSMEELTCFLVGTSLDAYLLDLKSELALEITRRRTAGTEVPFKLQFPKSNECQGGKLYTGRDEITKAFNRVSDRNPVKWDTIHKIYFSEQGLKITYPPAGKKIPRLLHSDLLSFFGL